jgi:quercetin dioxygenase-like cupin family protein
MNAKSAFTGLMILCCHVALAQSQSQQPVQKASSQVLLEQILSEKDLKNNMVRLETVVFPPSYASRSHIHPCPLFVYVLEGELLSEFEGVKKVYKAGDTFYEHASGLHSITKNNSDKTIAKILVIYLMTPGMETFLPSEH